MRSKFKVGITGVVAAVLVAIGAFGVGGIDSSQAKILTSSTYCAGDSSTADNMCVFVVAEHAIDPGTNTTGIQAYSCEQGAGYDSQDSPYGIVKPYESLHIDTENFPPFTGSTPLIRVPTGESVLICVNAEGYQPESDSPGDLLFDSNDAGYWDRPACGPDGSGSDSDVRIAEWPDDACDGPIGVGTDYLVIPVDPSGSGGNLANDLTTVIARYNCGSFVGTTLVTIQQDNTDDSSLSQFRISCRTNPDDITLSCSPCTVEIVPARSNLSHSLIQAEAVYNAPGPDADNDFTIIGADVDFKTDRCAIETSAFTDDDYSDSDKDYYFRANLLEARLDYRALNVAIPATYAEFDYDANKYGVDETSSSYGSSSQVDTGFTFDVDSNIDGTVAAAWLHCDVHSGVTTATPGVATVSACWEVYGAADLCKFVTVTVIGPPASITVAASPTSLRCGEKSTITATVKDAIGQNVSDHTRVEFVTNLGGTLAGTGGVAGFAGPVVPISSNVGDTFGGVATAFLITSEVTSGPYEVVATSGGTSSTDGGYNYNGYESGYYSGTPTYLGGVFSTPPVSAQVTVTCNIPVAAAPAPAPTITAPRTGTGITPPNTGDAGLADSSGASWTLFAIGGIVALSLAGFATVKAARR